MKIGDASKYQPAGSDIWNLCDGWIIQTSHGTQEEPGWRDQFNRLVQFGRPIGFYHFAESLDPAGAEREARFFYDLVGGGWVNPQLGWWLDAETGQSDSWVDTFRGSVDLPYCGVYSNGEGFNRNMGGRYNHFGLNWLAEPSGTTITPMPDHVLIQTGTETSPDGTTFDVSIWYPAQPMPPVWKG